MARQGNTRNGGGVGSGGRNGGGARSLQEEIGKRRPFEVAEVEVFLNILRTASILTTETQRFLRKHDLSEATYNALRILRGHANGAGKSGAGGVPSQTIGEQLVAQVPDVTRLVDRLVEAGYAERARTEADRRVVIVKITKKGLDLLAKLDRPLVELHQRQLGHLSKSEKGTLNGLLVKARRRPGGAGSGDGDDVLERCPG